MRGRAKAENGREGVGSSHAHQSRSVARRDVSMRIQLNNGRWGQINRVESSRRAEELVRCLFLAYVDLVVEGLQNPDSDGHVAEVVVPHFRNKR